MFRNISSLILAGALALPVAPAALGEYQEYCLHNTGGYAAGFHIEVVKRGPPNKNAAPRDPISHKAFFTSATNSVLSPRTRCVRASEAGVQPGDAIRVWLNPIGDINNKGGRHCGPNRDRAHNNEGLFLIPDGRPEGKLVFKSWGGLYHTSCELEHSGVERMHSACGATVEGMDNVGCNRFELDQKWDLGNRSSVRTIVPEAAARNTTVGQFYDMLVRGGHDPDQARNDGTTALHIAAREGRGDLLDVLIQRGANLDARMDNGSTALLTALTSRRFDMAEKLINAGAHPSLAREDGEFPLRYAASQGPREMVDLLLDHGALINAQHSETGQTALDAAKARQDRGRDEVLDLLRRRGAEDRIHLEVVPNLVAINASVEKLENALRDGADANEATGDGLTGLHIAARDNLTQYLDVLVRHGADLNAQDGEGRSPLMTAIEQGDSSDSFVVSMLFDHDDDVDPNLARWDGSFPLYLATELGNADVVDVLLFSRSIEVNQRHQSTKKTALKLTDELFDQTGRGAYQAIQESLLNQGAGR